MHKSSQFATHAILGTSSCSLCRYTYKLLDILGYLTKHHTVTLPQLGKVPSHGPVLIVLNQQLELSPDVSRRYRRVRSSELLVVGRRYQKAGADGYAERDIRGLPLITILVRRERVPNRIARYSLLGQQGQRRAVTVEPWSGAIRYRRGRWRRCGSDSECRCDIYDTEADASCREWREHSHSNNNNRVEEMNGSGIR